MGPVDVLVLDGRNDQYVTILQLVEPQLAPDALVLADLGKDDPDLRRYQGHVRNAEHGYCSIELPLDAGLEVSVRIPNPSALDQAPRSIESESAEKPRHRKVPRTSTARPGSTAASHNTERYGGRSAKRSKRSKGTRPRETASVPFGAQQTPVRPDEAGVFGSSHGAVENRPRERLQLAPSAPAGVGREAPRRPPHRPIAPTVDKEIEPRLGASRARLTSTGVQPVAARCVRSAGSRQ
jgi:hypothetical protein